MQNISVLEIQLTAMSNQLFNILLSLKVFKMKHHAYHHTFASIRIALGKMSQLKENLSINSLIGFVSFLLQFIPFIPETIADAVVEMEIF